MEGLACHQPVSGSSRKYDKKLINYLLVSRQIPPELQIRIIRHLKPWIEVTKTKINFGLPKEFKTMALMVTGYALMSKLWAKEVRILYYRFCHILEHRHTRSFFASLTKSIVGPHSGGHWIQTLGFSFCPSDNDHFWEGFNAAIKTMVSLERFDMCIDPGDRASITRWSKRAHLFPDTLRTLHIHPIKDEATTVGNPHMISGILNLTGYGCRVLKYIPIVQLSGKRNRSLTT